MTTRPILLGLCVFAALSTSWCVLAAVEEGEPVEITEIEMKFADCPTAVQKAFQQEAVGAKLNEVVQITEDEKTFYKASITVDAREYEIIVDEDGTLVAKLLNDDDEVTIELKFADCPVAVQKTLKRESRGSEIGTVEKVINDEKMGYIINSKIDGHDYEIAVAENGILISKLLVEEEKEDDSEKTGNEDRKT